MPLQVTPAPPSADPIPSNVQMNEDGTSVTAPLDPKPAAEKPAAEAGKPTERPAWLPEGFDTPEAFAEAWKAAQSKPEAPKPGKLEITPAPDPKTTEVDLDAIESEFFDKGEITAETYQAAQAKGMGKAQVDAYLAGRQAEAEKFLGELNESVGDVNALIAWAGSALNEAEIKSVNALLKSADKETVRLAVEGLASRQEKALGGSPLRVNGGQTPGNKGPKSFASQAEMVAAISDPRYEKDSAYRQTVEDRLVASKGLVFYTYNG